MNKEQFIQKAQEALTDNPLDRLSVNTRALVENKKFIADVHCHIFDKDCINILYFLARLVAEKLGFTSILSNKRLSKKLQLDKRDFPLLQLELRDIYSDDQFNANPKITDSEENWNKLQGELEKLLAKIDDFERFNKKKFTPKDVTLRYSVNGLLQALKVIRKKSMEEVFKFYYDNYSLNTIKAELNLNDYAFITVALMMDLEIGWRTSIKKNVSQQITELNTLADNYPVLPFFSVDPRRATEVGTTNLYELFLQAFCNKNARFFGVKIYPSLGYLPSDERLHPIYQICEEKNIPVLTHCGGEVISTYDNPINVIRCQNGKCESTQISGKTREDRAKVLNEPIEWEYVLQKFPKLKLNFGHFGGSDAWAALRDSNTSPRIDKIKDLMQHYEAVFADFSFNLIDDSLDATLLNTLNQNNKIDERTLFGTDFWVVLSSGDLNQRQKDFIFNLNNHRINLISKNIANYLF